MYGCETIPLGIEFDGFAGSKGAAINSPLRNWLEMSPRPSRAAGQARRLDHDGRATVTRLAFTSHAPVAAGHRAGPESGRSRIRAVPSSRKFPSPK